jgi:type I site-specific restriction-modification system R (restriction) subunit
LPFNLGWNDGAGNPPNPDSLKTYYLWKRLLTRESLTNILESYAQVVVSKELKPPHDDHNLRFRLSDLSLILKRSGSGLIDH